MSEKLNVLEEYKLTIEKTLEAKVKELLEQKWNDSPEWNPPDQALELDTVAQVLAQLPYEDVVKQALPENQGKLRDMLVANPEIRGMAVSAGQGGMYDLKSLKADILAYGASFAKELAFYDEENRIRGDLAYYADWLNDGYAADWYENRQEQLMDAYCAGEISEMNENVAVVEIASLGDEARDASRAAQALGNDGKGVPSMEQER